MTDANSSWAPPEEFDEYRIVRPLGTGSMGQVYLAHDLVLERTVAVKFVSPAVWNQKIRRRFLTEARAAARVQHPNVIAIYRIGEINRRPYIITEFASGTSLEKIPRPLPHEQVLRLALGLARGLAAAHRRGVLHRDIKLANAVLNEDGVVKILDFGLAKLDKLELEPDASSSGWSSTLGPNESTKKLLDPNAAKGSRTAAKNATKNAAKKARTASGAAASEGDAGEDGERDGNVDRLAATLPVEERELAEGDTEDDDEDARPAVSGRWRGIEVDSTVKPVVEKVRDSQSSDDDLLVGTPRYMAPELWRLEPATTRSDVYALGVMLYILCCDHTPYPEESPAALAALVQNEEPTPLQRHAPDVDPRLADVIGRCLKRDPADRYDSAESLRIALEALLDPAPEVLDTESNPYCGLLAFDADRRSVFFGRSEEIRAAVERLRDDPFVLVAGDSGVGKSSLCRAGVVPRVAEGALDPNLKWVCVSMVPGRRPLSTLLTVLTSELEFAGPPPESSLRSDDELLQAFSKSARDPSETTLAGAVRDELDGVLRAVRRRSGPEEGRLLFIDQLEELVTMSDPEEAATTGLLLARIAEGIPRMRLLATVRGDFITRVTQIEGFGAVIGRGLMLLQPLSPEGARAAVVGPAQSRGVRFESDALVNELVETGAGNSLPLLQFALAELWNVRDQARGVITARALETIGGVSGALARHAESVLTSLLPEQRLAARKLLLRLVTVDDTRATLPERDLTEGDADAQAALEALVKGRLVAARDSVEGVVYDITHEALISRWYTLRFWLDEKREARAVAGRVEVAAREWTRLGRPRDALWGGKQLSEASTLEREDLRKHEVEFLEASELLIRRKRRRRRAALSAPRPCCWR
ncbi:MAG: serine/threonine-protein kinase PknK [Myxococcales bacterium]|nr:serine/threonine-protein kinase PknK [Myxococcales bacterium]